MNFYNYNVQYEEFIFSFLIFVNFLNSLCKVQSNDDIIILNLDAAKPNVCKQNMGNNTQSNGLFLPPKKMAEILPKTKNIS